MADRIVVMDKGEIVQIGEPTAIYEHPRTRFVASFIGSPPINIVPAEIVDGGGALAAKVGEATLPFPAHLQSTYGHLRGKPIELGIRPEHFSEGAPASSLRAPFNANIEVVEPVGPDTMVVFPMGGVDVTARCSPATAGRPGAAMLLGIDMARVHLIDPGTGIVVPRPASSGSAQAA